METTFTGELFLIPIAAGIAAEIIKFLNQWRKHGWNLGYAVAYGHMPSAHTSFVISVVTVLGFTQGVLSPVFALSVAFATIVIFDAVRLRVFLGDHAKHINQIVEDLKLDPEKFPRLKERVGHKPIEVLAGAIFGFLFTTLLLGEWIEWL